MRIIIGYLIDLVLGDPAWLPHPVVMMGRLISRLEDGTRRVFPKTKKGEFLAGALTSLVTVGLTGFLCFGLVSVFGKEFPPLAIALDILFCWQALAVKGLGSEAVRIRKKLEVCEEIRKRGEEGCETGAAVKGLRSKEYEHALSAARKAVGRVVGRDTEALDEAGIIRATVETVAENFSDGVAAPLFYMALGGGPLALCYKAVNTLDSMIGYKNEKYLYFGRFGARLDDIAGFIPARIAALAFIITAALTPGLSGREALRIWRRDRKKHASPNSAQTESAAAGALGIRLAGPAYYFGEYYEKPYIGDDKRPVELKDIDRAVSMLYRASFGLVILAGAVNILIYGLGI